MVWKTDWGPGDNYARAGVTDLARLWSNYAAIRDLLNSDFGFSVLFTAPTFDGYKTVPLAAMLNATEAALNAIHVWPVTWTPSTTVWQAGGPAPGYDDINRWECNGQAMDDQADRTRDARIYCGEAFAGEY